ncbi:hypothetical protein B0T20DRAFT_153704 [Sordaria brevicollis]|uniref:Uncharacterized protein n=1 Tax=Sordaria brevicollis TaxID=83679 RepID=A0AAE0PIV3_SORBR|nr:hypothetical protein B0T20DRAFT_153704 [Sordaria brevicollis]
MTAMMTDSRTTRRSSRRPPTALTCLACVACAMSRRDIDRRRPTGYQPVNVCERQPQRMNGLRREKTAWNLESGIWNLPHLCHVCLTPLPIHAPTPSLHPSLSQDGCPQAACLMPSYPSCPCLAAGLAPWCRSGGSVLNNNWSVFPILPVWPSSSSSCLGQFGPVWASFGL